MKIKSYLCLAAILVPCACPLMGQTVWFKYPGDPVFDLGPPGTWEDSRVVPGQVILEDGTYKLWYTGWDGTPSRYYRVGYATSPHGSTGPVNPRIRFWTWVLPDYGTVGL